MGRRFTHTRGWYIEQSRRIANQRKASEDFRNGIRCTCPEIDGRPVMLPNGHQEGCPKYRPPVDVSKYYAHLYKKTDTPDSTDSK